MVSPTVRLSTSGTMGSAGGSQESLDYPPLGPSQTIPKGFSRAVQPCGGPVLSCTWYAVFPTGLGQLYGYLSGRSPGDVGSPTHDSQTSCLTLRHYAKCRSAPTISVHLRDITTHYVRDKVSTTSEYGAHSSRRQCWTPAPAAIPSEGCRRVQRITLQVTHQL